MGSQVAPELPRYRCHKEVWALKIKAVRLLPPAPPCMHSYGNTTCGYGPNENLHIGSDKGPVPPLGRHAYAPAEMWPYGLTESTIITPEDERYAPFAVTAAYVIKHKPEAGGWWVLHGDGYQSFSPGGAFEEGYTLIP